MAEPFLGEIRLTSFNFAPKGWAMCNGQILPINQNQPLFSLFGTTYGGNGQTTFALPDLRGRVAMHRTNGSSFTQGQRGGETAHTLTASELPQHIHVAAASGGDGDVPVPAGGRLAAFNNGYGAPASPTTLTPATITNAGGSQPHQNMSPYLVLNYVVALIGNFPSQT